MPSTVGDLERVGQHQRQQRRARRGAHRREVAEVDRQRPVPDGIRRHEAPVEMHAFDLRVGREHLERAALGLDHGGVVAGTDDDPGRHGEPRGDALDERALAEGTKPSWSAKCPALPCGEVE